MRPIRLNTIMCAACVAVLLIACQRGDDGKGGGKGGKGGKGGGGPTAVRLETAEIKTLPQDLQVIATLSGRAQADVFAKVVGRLSELGPAEGTAVKAGQVLFRVDRSDPGESFLSTPVVSPISGWIGRWYVTSLGEQITTTVPVVTVVDDEQLRAMADLPTREWLLVNKETPVAVTVGGEERAGQILTVARSGDAASGRGSVTIEVQNPGRTWRSGMVAKIKLGLEPKPRIVISSQALIITDRGAYVYVADGEIAKRVEVKFRLIDADTVEILAGLKDKDQVVVSGNNLLSDQAPIRAAPSKAEAPPPAAEPASKGG